MNIVETDHLVVGPLLVALLAVAVAGTIPASGWTQEVDGANEEGVVAETGETIWRLSGRIRPRIESRFNHRFGLDETEIDRGFQPDEQGAFTQQSRLGLNVQRGDLGGRFTLQHTAEWGQFGGDELSHPTLGVYEARMRYAPADGVVVDAGRFELAYGDERVLGSVGWSQPGRTWDGLRVGLRPAESVDIDVFGARYDEQQSPFVDGDAYLTGLYSTVDAPFGIVDVLDVYALYDRRGGRPGSEGMDASMARRDLGMVGTRWGFQVADFDATAEGGGQFGRVCDTPTSDGGCTEEIRGIRAYFVDLEAGWQLGSIRPHVGVSVASGDDPDTDLREGFDQMYPTGHAYLGYMDVIGPRTNVLEWRGGLTASFEGVDGHLRLHEFRRRQPESGRLGTEVDAKIFVAVADGLELGAGHGLFVPADGISTGDDEPEGFANWSFVQGVGQF